MQLSNRSLQYSFLLIMLLLISEPSEAQRILGAMSIGMNLTQVDGDEFYGFSKIGLNVGPQVIVPFGKNKNFSVSMELLYSQKGSYHRGGTDTTGFRMNLDYAEIPVLIHFTDKRTISGGVGFSYGQLINYKETKNNFFDSLFQYQTSLENNDISVIADLQIRIWSKLWANLRYQYSVRSNRTVLVSDPRTYPRNPFTRKQFNNVISIRLTWVFNQPKAGKNQKLELKQQE
ncbi:MAG: outer membrane beta-barrel protein [Bacteroidetes bacterium]|nr:outer membrane beta-barrel protein [Bacteroidota bacterium]